MTANDFLQDILVEFQKIKKQGDAALAQLRDEDFFTTLDPESNSIAILIKHLAGNMRSRWTDFLTSDGEKLDRHRDSEFLIDEGASRKSILGIWEQGWAILFQTLGSLKAEDVDKTVFIRKEPHSVFRAIHRQMTHYASHVGQIVFLAKHLAGARWKTLSIPRGKSEEFLGPRNA